MKKPLMFVILTAGSSWWGGNVVEVRVFSRRGLEKDERARAIERAEIERLAKDRDESSLFWKAATRAGCIHFSKARKLLQAQKI